MKFDRIIILTNKLYEEEMGLIGLTDDKVSILLKGDEYHNKISSKIDGYLEALTDFDIFEVSTVEHLYIGRDSEYFKLVDFYDED